MTLSPVTSMGIHLKTGRIHLAKAAKRLRLPLTLFAVAQIMFGIAALIGALR